MSSFDELHDGRVALHVRVGHRAIHEDLHAGDGVAPDVRGGRELAVRQPFGRGPANGDDATGAAVVVSVVVYTLRAQVAAQPKVGHLAHQPRGNQNVPAGEVAVDEVVRGQVLHAVRDVGAEPVLGGRGGGLAVGRVLLQQALERAVLAEGEDEHLGLARRDDAHQVHKMRVRADLRHQQRLVLELLLGQRQLGRVRPGLVHHALARHEVRRHVGRGRVIEEALPHLAKVALADLVDERQPRPFQLPRGQHNAGPTLRGQAKLLQHLRLGVKVGRGVALLPRAVLAERGKQAAGQENATESARNPGEDGGGCFTVAAFGCASGFIAGVVDGVAIDASEQCGATVARENFIERDHIHAPAVGAVLAVWAVAGGGGVIFRGDGKGPRMDGRCAPGRVCSDKFSIMRAEAAACRVGECLALPVDVERESGGPV